MRGFDLIVIHFCCCTDIIFFGGGFGRVKTALNDGQGGVGCGPLAECGAG